MSKVPGARALRRRWRGMCPLRADVALTWHVSRAQLADTKKGITDEDIAALASDEANQPAVIWELLDLQARPASLRV